MISITDSTFSLTFNLTQAISTDVYIGWITIEQTTIPSGGGTPSSQELNVSTSGSTVLLSSPTSTQQFIVQQFSITNKHASTTQTVKIQLTNGSNTYTIHQASLQPGWKLGYESDVGFQIFDNLGIQQSTFE